MRFGMNAQEADEAHAARGGGGGFMRYLKDGDNAMHILQEPEEWLYYYEHYNPGGYSFPCTNDKDTCPGCTSTVEKMKKPSMRVAFNVKQDDYVNAIKVPYTVAETLKNRYNRRGTITDREYIISKFKVNDRVNYDVEAGDPSKVSVDKSEFNDIEKMLADSYEEAWGDPDKSKQTISSALDAAAGRDLKSKLAKAAKDQEVKEQAQSEDPPSEPSADAKAEGEMVVSEADLRKMDAKELRVLCIQEFDQLPPSDEVDAIVDWMMQQS